VTLLSLVLTIVVVGVLLWLVESFIPMDPTIKRVLVVAVVVFLVLWIISATGLLDTLDTVRIGRR
jgi:hypothetical protein